MDGPFTVAHGRGSPTSQYGVPTRTERLNTRHVARLYLTKVYGFRGHAAGRRTFVGSSRRRLDGFTDNVRAPGRRAEKPYVTPSKAGRSEGCPVMEPARVAQLPSVRRCDGVPLRAGRQLDVERSPALRVVS